MYFGGPLIEISKTVGNRKQNKSQESRTKQKHQTLQTWPALAVQDQGSSHKEIMHFSMDVGGLLIEISKTVGNQKKKN